VQLLEREAALATMAEAREVAARGQGRIVLVTGEPGIGKTSLVSRFVADLGPAGRVLLGTCDDLLIPRPLGPIRDLAGSASDDLQEALAAGAAPHEVQALVLAELDLPPEPTVLVLEDVHWADDATLDLITVLGRRIASRPALLVLTFRTGEAPPGHPLHAVLGGIPADVSETIELAPLSPGAVASLAEAGGDELYATTRGNPFYVTELLAWDSPKLPPSVANAVLGRAARLDDAGRRLVELVSVVPTRVRASLLDAVLPDWASAAVEPERRRLLDVDAGSVRFRHELARNAIRSSLPIVERRRLHGQILEALLAADADPSDIVHHAEAAGREDVVADHALLAARRAAALDSNRQAYSHYRRAADFVDRLEPRDQGKLFEELAQAAYVVGRLEESFPAVERATAVYGELGDARAVGRCTWSLSRYHWFAGDGEAARRHGREAVVILEPLGETVELARAYSGLSQLGMLAEDPEQAFTWGGRALELAARLGDDRTRAHALINVGSTRNQLDPTDNAMLLEAHALADAAGDSHEATRALVNLAFGLMQWAQAGAARVYGEQALAYARKHEEHTFVAYLTMMHAWLHSRAGEWEEAERAARHELEREASVAQLLAKTVLAELAIRRGDANASGLLDDLVAQADRTRELQRLAPAVELAVERALTTDASMPTHLFEQLAGEIRSRGHTGWGAARVAGWAAVAGLDLGFEPPTAAPYASMAARDWRRAADDFEEIGWPYDRALMLSLLNEEPALDEALELARRLRAKPLTRRIVGLLRGLGLRVPAGRRATTRGNPAGLTARQLEVLSLLAEGLTNAEIAERLVVSQRTAEHHVAAVLLKLGAPTRRDAARRAAELQLV
jgi:predicted ATPase/DNA-binding CsgD family transcriptional regulator